jgi:hypothetical protein
VELAVVAVVVVTVIITIAVPQQVKTIPDISTLARLATKEGQERLVTMDIKVMAKVMKPADTD